MTARKKDEHHFQFAVGALCDALRLVWFHCPNELAGFITPGHYAQLVGQGFKPGVPDVMIQSRLPARREARGAFLELKAATGSAGAAQKLWSARLRADGYVGGLYRTLAAVCAFLRECGWDVDGALRDIEARGWVVAGDRLVRAAQRNEMAGRLVVDSAAMKKAAAAARSAPSGAKVGVK